jgi:hypothetical protein
MALQQQRKVKLKIMLAKSYSRSLYSITGLYFLYFLFIFDKKNSFTTLKENVKNPVQTLNNIHRTHE